jgi:hypothetical protein
MGGGGVKYYQKLRDVINGQPHKQCTMSAGTGSGKPSKRTPETKPNRKNRVQDNPIQKILVNDNFMILVIKKYSFIMIFKNIFCIIFLRNRYFFQWIKTCIQVLNIFKLFFSRS